MRNLVPLILVGFIVTLMGCSEKNTSPVNPGNDRVIAQDVPQEVQELLERYAFPEDGSVSLENLASSDVNSPSLTANEYDVYAVTILWGHLFNLAPPPSVTTDWSGTLSVNGEAIVTVRETIDFEPGQDSVLPPDAPYFAAWISYTQGDLDGLSFLVFLKRGVIYIVPPALTFDTPPFTISWYFETLVDFSAFYLVDSSNAVAVHSRKIWPNVCPAGMITGEWVKNEIFATDGYFSGLWLDRNSEPLGYLSGTFWTNTNGSREFAGSVSGYITDEVIAEVHGTWWYDDDRLCPMCGYGHGQFRGRFTYLNDGAGGSMWGEFGDYSLPYEELALPMSGIWREDCPAIISADVSPSAN